MSAARKGTDESEPATEALFVRLPAEHARRLDRAAFELRTPKRALVSELVERYVDPDSAASLAALAALGRRGARSDTGASPRAHSAGRRVTVETLEDDALVVGHHSFKPLEEERPARPLEVLNSEQAAELLQVKKRVVEELARAGELPGRCIAGEWRFSRQALLDWLVGPSAAPAASAARGEDTSER